MGATGYNSPTGYEESVSAVTATNSVELGSRRWVDGVSYVYVYNGGGEQISKRNICTPLSGSTSAYYVSVTTTSDACPAAGAVVHATLTTATYGWVCTNGQVVLSGNTQTALSLSELISPGDNGTVSTDAGAGANCGYVLSAMTGSAGTFNAWFKSSIY